MCKVTEDCNKNTEFYEGYSCKVSREEVQAFSDLLYSVVKRLDGSAEFYEGRSRKTAKEFFDDVKFYLGNLGDVRIWDYCYVEASE